MDMDVADSSGDVPVPLKNGEADSRVKDKAISDMETDITHSCDESEDLSAVAPKSDVKKQVENGLDGTSDGETSNTRSDVKSNMNGDIDVPIASNEDSLDQGRNGKNSVADISDTQDSVSDEKDEDGDNDDKDDEADIDEKDDEADIDEKDDEGEIDEKDEEGDSDDQKKANVDDLKTAENSVMEVSDVEKKDEEKNDSEKENANSDKNVKNQSKPDSADSNSLLDKNSESSDDIQIIGESKIIKISTPSNPKNLSQNILLVPPMVSSNSKVPGMNNRFMSASSSPIFNNVPGIITSAGFTNVHPSLMMGGASSHNTSPNLSMLPQSTVAPPKPKSSLDQIELIRWEIQNRINTRPKYFKPNPGADLGPLSKFLFDIGSDLIKESVYHELVKIQSKKQEDDKLSNKEKDDLEKLKDIEKDLNNTVGHLKLKMKKRCKMCHFHTESSNVMYHHKQYPHEDSKILLCSYCKFATKQPMAFKFHMEAEHSVRARLHDKKFFYECDLCQYENNQEQKLNVHKQRCAKQYRPLFNLHPSCLSGAEINLCLENIFYKPVVPKNLKILQQKHLQQQAALAEARRQQAEVAKLAAQKNAAQQAMLKRQQQQQRPSPQQNSRYTPPTSSNNRPQHQSRMQTPSMSQMRFNSRSPMTPGRPTLAQSVKDKQSAKLASGFSANHGNAPVGFEVCEICGGYVKDRKALRIHFFYAHRIDLPLNLFDRNQPPLYCATCSVRFWTANGLRKHLDVHAQEKRMPDGYMGEGVSGKCIACGQLVGNIVVHMRVVHNREIHHYINALMCMFCGASFNSHNNVERHVKDVHGTIDIATGAVKMKGRVKSSPSPMPKAAPPPKRPTPSSNNNLVKGSVCVLCNLNFGRNVDLTRHCMRTHHTCMKCGMVVIDKDSLLKHTCLSSPSGTRDCTMCPEAGFHPAYYVKHLRDKHLKKFAIDVARLSVPVIERWTKRSYPFKKRVPEVLVEISDSDEDEVQVTSVKIAPPVVRTGKKPRIGPASKINRPLLVNGVDTTSISCDNDVVTIEDDIKTETSPEASPAANKRKSVDSPGSAETPSKRKKSP